MNIGKKTLYGGIEISLETIASVAGETATECYGVVGLTTKNFSPEKMTTLSPDHFSQGIRVGKGKNGLFVNLYIIVAYGVKITEVVAEVQKRVKYVLEKNFDMKFKSINVYVQGLKTLDK